MIGNNYVVYFGGFLSNEYDISKENLSLIKEIKDKVKRCYGEQVIFIDPINLNRVSKTKALKLDKKSKKYSDLIIYIVRNNSSIYGLLDLYSVYEDDNSRNILIYSPDNFTDKLMVESYCSLTDKFLIFYNVDDILRHIEIDLENEEDGFADFLRSMYDMNDDSEDDDEEEVEEKVVVKKVEKPRREVKSKKKIMNERFDKLLERRGIELKEDAKPTTPKKQKQRAYVIGEKPPTGPASTYINIEADPTEPEPERVYDPTLYTDNFQATSTLPMQTARPKVPTAGFVESGTVGARYRSGVEYPAQQTNQNPVSPQPTAKLPMATVGSSRSSGVNNSNNLSPNAISGSNNIKIGQMDTNGKPAPSIVRVGENNSEGGSQIGRF